MKRHFSPRLRATARAASLAFGVSLLSLGAMHAAQAQSNATTTIYGNVPAAAAGATIVLENIDTGVQRTVTPDAKGHYLANSVPPGRYRVRLVRNGGTEASLDIEARIAAHSEALRPGGGGGQGAPPPPEAAAREGAAGEGTAPPSSERSGAV